MTLTPSPTLYLDADGCPVKEEAIQVALRHRWPIFVVANRYLTLPKRAGLEMVVVPGGTDVADTWIAERADARDVVITSDIPLAARAVAKGAVVLTPKSRRLDASNVGEALATRDLLTNLREGGLSTGGPAPFGPKDRSRFLNELDKLLGSLAR
jgi:uncharacterized protein YaiI (UPF0178 family)